MPGFALLASPWWVNLLILVPVAPYLLSRKAKFTLGRKRLLVIAVFGIAFGFVEAAVVVYLRAATGLWPVPQAYGPAALPESLVENRVLPRSGNHRDAGRNRLASRAKPQSKNRRVSLDLRVLGFLLLRLASSHHRLARLARQHRYSLPHSRAVARTGVVSPS